MSTEHKVKFSGGCGLELWEISGKFDVYADTPEFTGSVGADVTPVELAAIAVNLLRIASYSDADAATAALRGDPYVAAVLRDALKELAPWP